MGLVKVADPHPLQLQDCLKVDAGKRSGGVQYILLRKESEPGKTQARRRVEIRSESQAQLSFITVMGLGLYHDVV